MKFYLSYRILTCVVFSFLQSFHLCITPKTVQVFYMSESKRAPNFHPCLSPTLAVPLDMTPLPPSRPTAKVTIQLEGLKEHFAIFDIHILTVNTLFYPSRLHMLPITSIQSSWVNVWLLLTPNSVTLNI